MDFPSAWKTAAEAMLATIAAGTAILASPFAISKGRLIQERDLARADVVRLSATINALSVGADGLSSLAKEVGDLRNHVKSLEAVIKNLEAIQVVSARYIGELVMHIRDSGIEKTMPLVPPEISDDVVTQIRSREAQRASIGAA